MTFDSASVAACVTRLSEITKALRKFQEKPTNAEWHSITQYCGTHHGDPDRDTDFHMRNFFTEGDNAHDRLRIEQLHLQGMEVANELGALIRQVPALDFDGLTFQVLIGRPSRKGPRVYFKFVNEWRNPKSLPVLEDELARISACMSRVSMLPRPKGRVFLVADHQKIVAAHANAAMRIYAAFRKPELFEQDTPLSDLPEISELIDPVGPVRALRD